MPEPLPVDWKKENVPQDLLDLRHQLNLLPTNLRNRLVPLCDRVCHYTRLQSRLIKIAQDAVDQLQLDVKYLLFDLEVTRRERDAWRQDQDQELEE